jgi:hypothetical protein
MKHVLVLLILCLFVMNAHAESTICKIASDSFGFTTVGWDSKTGKAKITDSTGKSFEANVVLSRKHDDGYKTNIVVEFKRNYYGATSAEFIVFPFFGKYRIIGVGYIAKNGVRYLDVSYGNYETECLSL